jgi:hypothetical protein
MLVSGKLQRLAALQAANFVLTFRSLARKLTCGGLVIAAVTCQLVPV